MAALGSVSWRWESSLEQLYTVERDLPPPLLSTCESPTPRGRRCDGGVDRRRKVPFLHPEPYIGNNDPPVSLSGIKVGDIISYACACRPRQTAPKAYEVKAVPLHVFTERFGAPTLYWDRALLWALWVQCSEFRVATTLVHGPHGSRAGGGTRKVKTPL